MAPGNSLRISVSIFAITKTSLPARSKAKTTSGSKFTRPAWGYYGMSLEEVKPFVKQPTGAIKTTPLSSLDPLCGWTEEEKSAIISHIYQPSLYSPEIDSSVWMND